MNELDMPPARRLPDEVRDRALQTVLTTMDSPPRRGTPLLAAAAAAAVALTVTAVALSGSGPGGTGLDQLAPGRPVPGGDAEPAAPTTSRSVQVPTATTLEGCLAEAAPDGTVVLRHELAGLPPAWLATVGGSRAVLCVMGDEGPMPASVEIPPAEGRKQPSVLASTRDRTSGVTAALVAVPRDVTSVEIMTEPREGRGGVGATCALRDGLALCSLVEKVEIQVVAFTSGGVGHALPVP